MSGPELVFYDGNCGFCHHTVRFLLDRDPDGHSFRFASLQGETFPSVVPEALRAIVPDSVAAWTHDGRLLVRTAAMIHVLGKLPGPWPAIARAVGWFPEGIRDWGYDLFARHRHRFFGRTDDVCPVLAPELRARFDA